MPTPPRNHRHEISDRPESIDFARRQRRTSRSPEQLMWEILRNRNCADAKFKRQFPFGPYTLDYFCVELLLSIECDGANHFTLEGILRDRQRDAYLLERGVTTLRFENRVVEEETTRVRERITDFILSRRNSSASNLSDSNPSPPAPLP